MPLDTFVWCNAAWRKNGFLLQRSATKSTLVVDLTVAHASASQVQKLPDSCEVKWGMLPKMSFVCVCVRVCACVFFFQNDARYLVHVCSLHKFLTLEKRSSGVMESQHQGAVSYTATIEAPLPEPNEVLEFQYPNAPRPFLFLPHFARASQKALQPSIPQMSLVLDPHPTRLPPDPHVPHHWECSSYGRAWIIGSHHVGSHATSPLTCRSWSAVPLWTRRKSVLLKGNAKIVGLFITLTFGILVASYVSWSIPKAGSRVCSKARDPSTLNTSTASSLSTGHPPFHPPLSPSLVPHDMLPFHMPAV